MGRQHGNGRIPDFAMFNIDWPENALHGSTVSARTIVRLGIRDIFDREGNRLFAVPTGGNGLWTRKDTTG